MLRGILAGCGYFGQIHLEGWNRIEGARIVAVVDKDERAATEAANRVGAAAYTDLARAIDEVAPDFVDIATRPESHLELVEIAAPRGCHVLCQKPIALTWDESVQVVETCNGHGVRLMINENWRWQPWYQEIKKLVDAGAIGRVWTITLTRQGADALDTPPFPHRRHLLEMERFLLIESTIHLIDTTRFLGGEIREIYCDHRRLSGAMKGEDNLHVHLRLEGEVWGILYATRCSEPDVADAVCEQARIEGSEGFIRLDGDGTLTVKPLHRLAFQHQYTIPTAGYKGDSVRAALKHFVDCLSSQEPFQSGGDDYLNQVMRAVFAGYESAETQRSIPLQVQKA